MLAERAGDFSIRSGETTLQLLNRKSQDQDYKPRDVVTTAIHGVPGKA